MIRHTLLCIALAGLAACTGADGAAGEAGPNGAAGASSLVAITDEPAGANCAEGGRRVDVGLDDNGNGVLDTEEIDNTTYVCDGGPGPRTLVTSSAEPPGANCANGGQRIDIGADDNGNNILDPAEIETTSYTCNGADAVAHLVDVTAEPAGANCATGGRRIDHGMDANGNNVLDPAEIAGTSYVCNGANGSIVDVSDEPAGANCEAGGSQIDYGIDDNGNGVLEASEIDGTDYVCHGISASGVQVFTASGTFTPPPGITSFRVLVVGGGGGGPGSHWNGGGSGHVRVGTFNVTSAVTITVGGGGIGGQAGNQFPGTDGGASSFGAFLSAPGGQGGWYKAGDALAGDGGSGGGGAGNSGCGGAGGTAGSNGANGCTYNGSLGGNFDSLVSLVVSDVAAGAGGAAGTSSHGGGGGGGGVLIDGAGGPGANGAQTWSARGGAGYGGGGGAGGYNSANGYAIGGNGASGVVYVEW